MGPSSGGSPVQAAAPEAAAPEPEAASDEGQEDEDLEMFRSWLQSLKK
jgi:hypothetical protein